MTNHQHQRSLDTDTTWESSGSDDDEERGAQIVHKDGTPDDKDESSAPGKTTHGNLPTTRQRQVVEPVDDQKQKQKQKAIQKEQEQPADGRVTLLSAKAHDEGNDNSSSALVVVGHQEQQQQQQRLLERSKIGDEYGNNSTNDTQDQNNNKIDLTKTTTSIQLNVGGIDQQHRPVTSADRQSTEESLKGFYSNGEPNVTVLSSGEINPLENGRLSRREKNDERKGHDESGQLNTDKLDREAADAKSREVVCRTPFKFNSNLPSPSQVLSLNSSGTRISKDDKHRADFGQQVGAKETLRVTVASGIKLAPPIVGEAREPKRDTKMVTKFVTRPQLDNARDAKTQNGAHADKLSLSDDHAKAPASRTDLINRQEDPFGKSVSVRDGHAPSHDQDEAAAQNRLSIYENVAPGGGASGLASAKQLSASRLPPNDSNDDEPDTAPDEWSVEADDRTAPKAPAPRSQVVRKLVASFAAGQLNNTNNNTAKRTTTIGTSDEAKRPQRRLVTMTSIIQEPEDELMNVSVTSGRAAEQKSGQPVASGGNGLAGRRDSAFSFTNEDVLAGNNNNNSDSDSSFKAAVTSRRRIVGKFDQPSQSATSRPPNLPRSSLRASTSCAAASEQQAVGEHTAQARRPPAARGPVGGSLVRRLAKNFDQAGQQQERSGAAWRAAASLRPVASLEEEPKSDSTWYDAKSIEQLDETEVAELLRELGVDEDEDERTAPEAGGSTSTGAEPYVSVADSTLSHGRKDDHPRRPSDLGGQAAADDDDTLNDGDDEQEDNLMDSSAANELDANESLYVSAGASTQSLEGAGEERRAQRQTQAAADKGKDETSLFVA